MVTPALSMYGILALDLSDKSIIMIYTVHHLAELDHNLRHLLITFVEVLQAISTKVQLIKNMLKIDETQSSISNGELLILHPIGE